MRIILKIIAASFVLALILAVAVLSFLSCIAGAFCWLACTVFVLLAVCGFFAGLHTGCIAMLVLAFLVSPFGLPAIGLWLLACRSKNLRRACAQHPASVMPCAYRAL